MPWCLRGHRQLLRVGNRTTSGPAHTRYDESLVPLGESLRLGRTAMSATVAPCRLDASTEPL